MRSIGFESFGVRVRVTADVPGVLERIRRLLPPGARPCPVTDARESFGIVSEGDRTYRFERGESPVSGGLELDFTLSLMERELQKFVGLYAPEKIFVQAGVVELGGHAVVLPGLSFSGKSTLVSALVEEGARYYSQEFAVIDQDGLVHWFGTPIAGRRSEPLDGEVELSAMEGMSTKEPVPVGAVVFTEYQPGAEWRPRSLSLGQAVLAMFHHALLLPERSREGLRVLRQVLQDAMLLEGARGEAAEVAVRLLESAVGKTPRRDAGSQSVGSG